MNVSVLLPSTASITTITNYPPGAVFDSLPAVMKTSQFPLFVLESVDKRNWGGIYRKAERESSTAGRAVVVVAAAVSVSHIVDRLQSDSVVVVGKKNQSLHGMMMG